jgi:hypothetical protein
LQWLRNRRDGIVANPPNAFVCTFGPIYLTVLAILWASALPEYFGATDGITADANPYRQHRVRHGVLCRRSSRSIQRRHIGQDAARRSAPSNSARRRTPIIRSQRRAIIPRRCTRQCRELGEGQR